MKYLLVILCFLFSLPVWADTYTVISVHDGDTITVESSSIKQNVRLLGLDCPELKQDFGPQAQQFTSGMVLNKQVTLELDRVPKDLYGRTLAYVYVNGVMLNNAILSSGYAISLPMGSDRRYAVLFAASEASAKSQGLNIWDPIKGLKETPAQFRARMKHRPYPSPTPTAVVFVAK